MPEHTIQLDSPGRVNQVCCGESWLLGEVEKAFSLKITARDDWLKLEGSQKGIDQGTKFFKLMELALNQGLRVGKVDFRNILRSVQKGQEAEYESLFKSPYKIHAQKRSIVPKTINQKRYLQYIEDNDIVFGVGPAGTGKTFLAVAAAIKNLLDGKHQKIILTRPAVEAGEALGFLPGDLEEKILPYLRPLYDAMDEILGPEQASRLIERGVIEIAPLAYMRGRTLSNAFIILDEAQNSTHEQMMMFLTRLGNKSQMVITGDITQVDLPKKQGSGLKQAVQVLSAVEGIKLFYFESIDVVRHPLVKRIIDAYERFFKKAD